MKARLVFDDWRIVGKSIYNTELGMLLSGGELHSGTTWAVEVNLPPEIAAELEAAWEEHRACAYFRLAPG